MTRTQQAYVDEVNDLLDTMCDEACCCDELYKCWVCRTSGLLKDALLRMIEEGDA